MRTNFPLAGSKALSRSPDANQTSAVKRYPVYLFGVRKGPLLTKDFSCRFHAAILVTRQRTGE